MNFQDEALDHEGFIHIDQAREAAVMAAADHLDGNADHARDIIGMTSEGFLNRKHMLTPDEVRARNAAKDAVGLVAGYILGR